MSASGKKPVIAVLLGDAAGVGPELIAKTMAEGVFQRRCRPVVIGDRRVLERGMRQAGVGFSYHSIPSIDKPEFSGPVNLLDTGDVDPDAVPVGEISALSGEAAARTLLTAVDYYRQGHVNGIIFGPLNKAAMKAGGRQFESEHSMVGGHLGLTTPFGEVNVLDGVFTSRVTSHVPMREVADRITKQSVLDSIRLLNFTVRQAGVPSPRLGVAALNPHSGENGTCGREEIDAIAPAVEAARAEGIDAAGPVSADVLFFKTFGGEFQAAVTMYHDQGQIALKTRGFENAVTVFGGIPVPVATPAHGTAFDISGRNMARTGAMKSAIDVIVNMGLRDMGVREK